MIAGEIQTKIENDTLSMVQNYGFNVDKDELAKALEYDRNQYEKGYKDGSRNMLKWILTSEKLPDLFEVVLVTDETGKVFEYERRPLDEEGNVCEKWTFLGRNIIAWMPLPEPYKEAENECKNDT
jgi:hypothetical protein